MGKINSRDKGARGEQQVVKLLKAWWGSEFYRTPRSGAFATQGFSHKDMSVAADVVTPDHTFPFSVEVKWQESWNMEQLLKSAICDPWKWWEQCVTECTVNKIPLLVFKRNNQPWFYMLEELDTLHRDLQGAYFMVPVPASVRESCLTKYSTRTVRIGLFEDLKKTTKTVWASG